MRMRKCIRDANGKLDLIEKTATKRERGKERKRERVSKHGILREERSADIDGMTIGWRILGGSHKVKALKGSGTVSG